MRSLQPETCAPLGLVAVRVLQDVQLQSEENAAGGVRQRRQLGLLVEALAAHVREEMPKGSTGITPAPSWDLAPVVWGVLQRPERKHIANRQQRSRR
jgi:hypothetical protein